MDPHWWQDPRNAVRAVAAIEAALARADPAGAAAYERAARAYTARIERLDAAVADCLGRLAPAQRKLVTTHDALGYYAARYGLEVIGAVIPSLSTQAQASAGEVTDLVATIQREGVRAIFAESSVNPELERVVADESGARIGDALYADTLGPEDSDGATLPRVDRRQHARHRRRAERRDAQLRASGLNSVSRSACPGEIGADGSRARRPAPSPHRPAGGGRAAGRRRRAVDRLRRDPRPHLGARGAVPRAGAEPGGGLPRAARAAPAGRRHGGHLPRRDRRHRAAGGAPAPAAGRRGRGPDRGGPGLRRGHHGRPRAARVPRARLRDRRARPLGARAQRRLAAGRRRRHARRSRPRRRHRHRRRHHDHLPDAVHAAGGAGLGGARARRCCRPPRGPAGATSVTGSRRRCRAT